jgi:hypothetical protein
MSEAKPRLVEPAFITPTCPRCGWVPDSGFLVQPGYKKLKPDSITAEITGWFWRCPSCRCASELRTPGDEDV